MQRPAVPSHARRQILRPLPPMDLPFLLLVSLFTGALSGLITAFLFRAMAHTPYGTKGENQHG